MQILYNVLLGVSVIVAVMFSVLVFVTGKGDAMSGGGQIRTTYRGKANFDDIISRVILFSGIAFMVLMLVLDIISNRLPR